MNAHQRRGCVNIPHDQSHSFFNFVPIGTGGAKAVNPKFAPAGGKLGRGYWLDCFGGHKLIIVAVQQEEYEPAPS